MLRKNDINEFNLVSCYQKQEMKLNSLFIKYFSFLMTINLLKEIISNKWNI